MASLQMVNTFRERLESSLQRFAATRVGDITDLYAYHPTRDSAILGEGAFGTAYRMRSLTAPSDPPVVVKAISKAKAALRQVGVRNICAELAVTGFIRHPHLNHRVGLYHNAETIFVLLELVEGTPPDLATRLALLFSRHYPGRFELFDGDLCSLREAGTDRETVFSRIMAECGARHELPFSGDLYGHIVSQKRFSEAAARIIIKQLLLGLQHLHENRIVHRDVKTENIVLGITRTSELDRDAVTGALRGVRIIEEINVKLIDFGLVKYMDIGRFPEVISPGMFQQPAPSQQRTAGFETMTFEQPAQPAATFGIDVTPCGTAAYSSMEAVSAFIGGKWKSNAVNLPKLDVYGAGTVLFCCVHGRPPYSPSSGLPKAVYLRELSTLMSRGPKISSSVSDATKKFIQLLMQNDPALRPSAAEALANPYLQTVTTNRCTYTVTADGQTSPVELLQLSQRDPLAEEARAAVLIAASEAPAEEYSKEDDIHLMTVLRAEEDRDDEPIPQE